MIEYAEPSDVAFCHALQRVMDCSNFRYELTPAAQRYGDEHKSEVLPEDELVDITNEISSDLRKIQVNVHYLFTELDCSEKIMEVDVVGHA